MFDGEQKKLGSTVLTAILRIVCLRLELWQVVSVFSKTVHYLKPVYSRWSMSYSLTRSLFMVLLIIAVSISFRIEESILFHSQAKLVRLLPGGNFMSKPISGLFSGTKGEGAALVFQLKAKGEKFDEKSIVAITKDSSGKIVWLEKGHLGDHPSGLAHIVDSHGDDFAKQGISEKEIPQYIMTALKHGKIVGYQGRGQGRPIYEFTYEGTTRRIAITVASNGYIVGANPRSVQKEVKK